MDAACREHDIAYSRNNEQASRHVLVDRARKRIIAKDSTLGERAAATAVWAAMKAKTKFGIGMTKKRMKKKTKSRLLPVAKRGGILPLLPLLGVIGSLAGGAAGVAKVVNDAKAAQRQLEEMKRHNRAMEGHGLYLAPYKQGKGVSRRKKKRQKSDKDARRCHHQFTVATIGEAYANTIFPRSLHAQRFTVQDTSK